MYTSTSLQIYMYTYIHLSINVYVCTYVSIYKQTKKKNIYIWHLLICFVHSSHEGRACTQNLILALPCALPLCACWAIPTERSEACSERSDEVRDC